MTIVDVKSVGQYAEYQIGYDILATNQEAGYHIIRCYGVLNVTGNNWSANNIRARVVDYTEYIDYGYYTTGANTLVYLDLYVYANDEGSCTFTFSGQITSGYQSSDVASGTITLPDIPRASIPTINNQTTNQPNFNIGDTIRIYTNRKSTSFTNNIYFNYGNQSIQIATEVTDYYDFDTSTVASDLYNLIPNDSSIQGTISVDTYKGSSQIGTRKSCNYNAKVVDANPTFENFTFADVNSTTTTLTGNNQKIITNYSNVTITISTTNKAVAIKGATMDKYRFVIGNKSIEVPYSDSASVTGTITGVPIGVFQVYAIDSRGNSTFVTKQATSTIEYTPIVKTSEPSPKRNTGVGEEYTLQYAGTYWNNNFGSVTNTITSATYKYKKTTSSTWINGTTTITPTLSSENFSFSGLIKGDTNSGFNIDYSYNIEVTITDKLSTAKYEVVLISGKPNIAIAEEGVSIGGKYDTSEGGLLQLDGKSIFNLVYPVGSVYTTTDSTFNPNTSWGGTWTQLTADAYLKIVTSSAGNTGGTSSDHKIPLTSIPSHNHKLPIAGTAGSSSYLISSYTTANKVLLGATGDEGGGQAYYPYYYGVYAWHRDS